MTPEAVAALAVIAAPGAIVIVVALHKGYHVKMWKGDPWPPFRDTKDERDANGRDD